MSVMPVGSNHTIPEAFHPLMTDEDSEISQYYPEEFDIDLNGKKFAWQGVALLPFMDQKLLLAAMATKYPMLSKEEHERNEVGKEALLFSTRHPLHDEIALHFYSKKAGAPKLNLKPHVSQGMSGKVEKNESYLPSSALVFPLPNGGMPDLDEDASMSVYYSMPPTSSSHKSMLLPGVKPPAPVLDHSDIAMTKSRASNSGRGYGGAPLDNQNGGRGRINYGGGDSRNGNGGRGGRDSYGGGGRGGGGYQSNGHNGGGGGYQGNGYNGGGGGYQGNGYNGGGNRGGYQSGPPPSRMPFDPSALPPHLAQQAAAHGFAPPPPAWAAANRGMPPMPPPPYDNYGGNGHNGHNGYGGRGGNRGGGGGRNGGGGYDRY